MLSVDIEKRLDAFTLNVRFSVDRSVTALFGASGAGKSMTLKCIAGIEKPDRGRIVLNDRVLFDSEKHVNLPPQKRHVGYLFQDYALFPDMTVQGNVEAGLHRLPRRERRQKAVEWMEQFQIGRLAKQPIDRISGGEKQRVALARIFASAPEVLLLDEPFSSLDALLKLELLPYVREVLSGFGGETVLVSHQVDEVLRLSQTVTALSGGQAGRTQSIEDFYAEINEKYQDAGLILPALTL